jgi:hypothetical protein
MSATNRQPPMHVTDFPSSDDAALEAMRQLDPATRADIEHLRNIDTANNGLRAEVQRETAELHGRKNENAVRKGFFARDISRTGPPKRAEIDPKTGATIRLVEYDWEKPYNDEAAEIEARLNALQSKSKSIAPSIMPTITELFTQMHRVTWRRIDPPNVAKEGSTPLEILADRRAGTDLANDDFDRVQGARRTIAECVARAERDIARRVKMGAPRYGLLFQGGSFGHDGRFNHKNAKAAIQFPKMRSTESDGFAPAIVDDSINFAFWRDAACDNGKMAKAILKDIREFGDDSVAVSERDKPGRLKAAAAAILEAQRAEEAACRLCEANGISVKRRMDQAPVTVLLNIERDDFKPSPVAEVDQPETADDFN